MALGEIGVWLGGGTPSKSRAEFWEGGTIPWVSPKDMKTAFIRDAEDHITTSALADSAAKLIPSGSILIVTRSGILEHSLPVATARVAVAINQDLKAITPAPRIDPDYVRYALVRFADEILRECSKAGTTVSSIVTAKLQRFEIPVAPQEEQERVVRSLEALTSRLDAAADAFLRARANLKRYRASLLKVACEGQLVPTEAELARREDRDYEPANVLLERILKERRAKWEEQELEKLRVKGKEPRDDRWKRKYREPEGPDTSGLPELPEGWVWSRLEQLGDPVTGTTPSTSDPANFGGSLPFLKPTDLDAGYRVCEAREFLTEQGASKARLLPELTLLVTCIGATIGKVGLARRECTTNQQINALIPAVGSPLPQYLFWLMVSPFGQRVIKKHASATTLPILNKTKFSRLAVPLPPLAEQERIVLEIERLWSIVESGERAVESNRLRADRLRQSILKRAFEGRLVAQDPSEEPASRPLERIQAEREESEARVGAGR